MDFRISPGPQLLRMQVYEYLRKELKVGNLKPGSFIRMNQIMKKLDFSRTPLRDAFLQLQSEGFVTFLPQRGIRINELNQQDIANMYELLGALDSRAMLSVFDKLGDRELERMTHLNEEMGKNLTKPKFTVYWDLNTDFHNVYLDFSSNEPLLYQINILRQRLFEFGKRDWSPKMKRFNYEEHIEMMALIHKGNAVKTADYIRDVHCVINY